MKIKILSVYVFTLLLLGCDSVDRQWRVIDTDDAIENNESISNINQLQTQPNNESESVPHDPELFKNANLKEKWQLENLSEDELKELYEITKKESFANIAQTIYEVSNAKLSWEDERIIMFASARAPDWRNKKYSLALRKKIMAQEIWNNFVQSKPSEEVANAILELLRKAKTIQEKNKLIHELEYDQWTSDAEDALYSIAVNRKENVNTRISALRVLFRRCDINKYISVGIDIVIENTKTTERCTLFDKVFSFGNNFFNLKKENQKLIIETGFEILITLDESDYNIGYGIACTFGRFLKNEFKPDQKDEKYQDEHGLNELFFTDTVRNAIKWYEFNKNNLLPD